MRRDTTLLLAILFMVTHLYASNPYSVIQEKKLKDKVIIWVEHSDAKTVFFRLGDGFPKSVQKIINPILEKIHKKYSQKIELAIGDKIYQKLDANMTHLSNNMIGFSIESLDYRLFAYTEHYLYDLHSGKRYIASDILRFGEGKNQLNFHTLLELIYEANSWDKSFLVNRKESYTNNRDSCEYSAYNSLQDEYSDEYFTHDFMEEGLNRGYFSNVGYVVKSFYEPKCDKKYTIPYDMLKSYKIDSFSYDLESLKKGVVE